MFCSSKEAGIRQKLHWGKGYKAQQEWSEAWKFWYVLISRDFKHA